MAWNTDMLKAFHESRMTLLEAMMLPHPLFHAPIVLSADVSDMAVGAVFEQFADNTWQPLGLFSRQLRTPEQKYST